ncbi:MAG: FitA-like ribbon-helix-helix domain-containing protein [Gammaproteobacteria bacterium]
MVQIRNVPDDLHRKLKARAALAGMSISEYLLREIEKSRASHPGGAAAATQATRAGGSLRARGEGGGRGAGESVIVPDASTVLEILLQTEAGAPVAERPLLTSDSSLHAPHLLDVEVA